MQQRPFTSLAQLKYAMVGVLNASGIEPQWALIRAHPELAGKTMVDKSLTAESSNEQSKAGLTHCTPQEFETIQAYTHFPGTILVPVLLFIYASPT